MRLETELRQRLEQRMKLSQQMVQSLELLQLPIMDLRELIMQELAENPTLETSQDIDEQQEEQTISTDTRKEEEEGDKLDVLNYIEESLNEGRTRKPNYDEEDVKFDMMQNTAAGAITLQEHLHNQLILMDIPDDIKTIAQQIIYNIDDDGYLKATVEEIASSLKEQFPNLTDAELLDNIVMVLEIIQKLEPRGVGARDAKECILLQLSDEDPRYELKKHLIHNYLDDIGQNRLPKIANEVKVDLTELKVIVNELSKLKLKPGSTFSKDKTPPVYPEVTVKEIDGKYEVAIEDSYLPPIYISRHYQEMLKNTKLSKEEKDFIKKKLSSSRWLINAIEHRKSTLYRISEEIVKQQYEFFEKGIEYLKPLTMQQVANILGIHVSTVSRAVSDKYMDTPRGIFNVKFFFASAAETSTDNNQQTRLSLISKLEELIQSEDKKSPLSDSQIADILKKDGMSVARRTVTKIREEINIPSSRIRRQY